MKYKTFKHLIFFCFCVCVFLRKRSLSKFDLAVSKIKEEAGKAADTGAALKTSLGKLYLYTGWSIKKQQEKFSYLVRISYFFYMFYMKRNYCKNKCGSSGAAGANNSLRWSVKYFTAIPY